MLSQLLHDLTDRLFQLTYVFSIVTEDVDLNRAQPTLHPASLTQVVSRMLPRT